MNQNDNTVTIEIPTSAAMRKVGEELARILRSQDVVLLSGPLGAGKTTFAQGIGVGLEIKEPVVSPTFTIARELRGKFANGDPVRLIHVDAYRIGGVEHAPGNDVATALLDELESLGLDEELESPAEGSVVLMEWGEHMAGIFSDERLEISIDRSVSTSADPSEMTSDGVRHMYLSPVGANWMNRRDALVSLAQTGKSADLDSKSSTIGEGDE